MFIELFMIIKFEWLYYSPFSNLSLSFITYKLEADDEAGMVIGVVEVTAGIPVVI